MAESDYNRRLFSKGFRRSLHLARFRWLADTIKRHGLVTSRVIELGCFDGRSLQYIYPRPMKYVGYDANWENGLEIARNSFSSFDDYSFIECNIPNQFNHQEEVFTLSISLETLEHIPTELLDEYLKKISKSVDGHFLVTVPNEKGLLFLAKYLAKRLVYGNCDKYSPREFIAAILGHMQYVERNQHKGFDYSQLKEHLLIYFDLVEERGIPLSISPLWLSTQIGFVLKSKNT